MSQAEKVEGATNVNTENVNTDTTVALMDNEIESIREHQQRIGALALEIEAILLREDISMGDLSEILDLFNSRAHAVFSRTKIKDVKHLYEQPQ